MEAEDFGGALCAVGVPFLSHVAKHLILQSPMGPYAVRVFSCVEELAVAIANEVELASGFRRLFRCHFARTRVFEHRKSKD